MAKFNQCAVIVLASILAGGAYAQPGRGGGGGGHFGGGAAMRIKVDRELCQGHGRCYSVAGDVYQADEQGRRSWRGTNRLAAARSADRAFEFRRHGAVGRRTGNQ